MPDVAVLAGEPPLTPRWEPWMRAVLADPARCAAAIDDHGSPVNLLNPEPLARNATELVDTASARSVDLGVFFARKANKALCFVDAAARAGHGVDVASHAELTQVLDAGVRGERIIVTAAIKPRPLLHLALTAGATISLDHGGELSEVAALAADLGVRAVVALRLALPPSSGVAPTRFGERANRWLEADLSGVEVAGVHFHLNGYAAHERGLGIVAACHLVDALRARGHQPWFVDAGGGVPMSYLDDPAEWDAFWAHQRAAEAGEAEPVPWNGAPLGRVYPFHQRPVRGAWLGLVLDGGAPGEGTIAQALEGRRLKLHLEPGRALLDGCGVTIARVAFTKHRSDGVGLIALEMNRTQCRTTSDDFLVDPALLRFSAPAGPFAGFLVGGYCIEDEVILKRRLTALQGVGAGDLVVLPNTAGYFMHILESASHQWPLARNLVWRPDVPWALDAIDAPAP